MKARYLVRGSSAGQAVVEAAVALLLLAILLTGGLSVGQTLNYNIGLDNAAAAGAAAAATQANESNGNPSSGAVAAVNQEQGSSSWSACGTPVVAPCVSVSAATDSTGSGSSVTVERVTLHGSASPVFSLLGVTIPVTATAAAAK